MSFIVAANACAELTSDKEAQKLVQLREEKYPKEITTPGPRLSTALVNMYAKCGEIETAEQNFRNIPNKDAIAWNTMITAYANHGFHAEAMQLVKEMREAGVQATSVTYVALLIACSHAGKVEDGMKLWEELKQNRRIVRDAV